MFRDRDGKRRPIARMGAMPALFYDRFSRMDDVIGWGGQLGSFEAVFSPLDRNGRPRKLWDRSTGAIDPEVAKAWEAYDIRLVLERNWPTLGPKLKGKLHVITGGLDTFYLEGAVKLLKESLAKLGSDAVVEIIPDRDHGTLLDPQLAERLDREMQAAVGDLLPSTAASAGIKPRFRADDCRSNTEEYARCPCSSARNTSSRRTSSTPFASGWSTGCRRRRSWRGSAKSCCRRPSCRWRSRSCTSR